MTRGDLHYPFDAALVAIAALVLLLQGASAQIQCSETKLCPNNNCCSQYKFCGTTSAYCGAGCKSGPCTGTGAPPAGGSGWSSFLTKAKFEKFFPSHVPFYTYETFKAAAAAPQFSKFGKAGALEDQERELAAFLANVNQESGELKYIEEGNKLVLCDSSTSQYPCAAGKKYYGRCPLQLSWNFNYGACGNALGLNLLANPDQVAQNSATAWKTALWFWMTKGPHDKILAKSFSGTIRAIKGAKECNQPTGSLGNQQMLNRVKYYQNFCNELGVNPGTNLKC